ncbi:hypothetical protein C5L33_000672 [Lactobacillus pasteurii]|uniref:hypothetical protein n=1 Tax=Lactobacillus pasteurii TaxID=872327 RepID=UPI001058BBB0|nr:hypothetical protein [Lactobacillus pasteurii]TDG77029.1 hypothetical protein C5L33_000672 [Lactobacillus pasteurii]
MTNTSFRKLMAKTATATVSAAILGQLLVTPAYATETNSELSETVQTSGKAESSDQNQSGVSSTEHFKGLSEDPTEITDGQGNKTTTGEWAKKLNNENDLGIASGFGVFAEKVTVTERADVNSSIATNELDTNSSYRFGTRGKEVNNNATSDVNYIRHATLSDYSFCQMGQANGVHGEHIVFGKDTKIKQTRTDENAVVIFDQEHETRMNDFHNGKDGNKLETEKEDGAYLDVTGVLDDLSKKSVAWQEKQGLKIDTNAMNGIDININEMTADSDNHIYVTVPESVIKNGNAVLKLNRLESLDGKKTTVILNVQSSGDQLDVMAKCEFNYGGQSMGAAETHPHQNHVIWNFGSNVKKLSINNDKIMGSVLATDAKLFVGKNIDGNIIAKEVTIAAENHEWDLADSSNPSIPWTPVVPSQDDPSDNPLAPGKKPDDKKPDDKKPDDKKPDDKKPDGKKPDDKKPDGKKPDDKKPDDKKPDDKKPSTPVVPSQDDPSDNPLAPLPKEPITDLPDVNPGQTTDVEKTTIISGYKPLPKKVHSKTTTSVKHLVLKNNQSTNNKATKLTATNTNQNTTNHILPQTGEKKTSGVLGTILAWLGLSLLAGMLYDPKKKR